MKRPFFVAIFLLAAPFVAAQTYTVTDLGPGGGLGGGRAINNLGDVAVDNLGNTFIWTPTHHYLALTPLSGGYATQAMGMNSHGIVVGESFVGTGYIATSWANGKPFNLGTLPGGVLSWAEAINSSGQIAGASDSSTTGPQAAVWTGNSVVALGFLPGGSYSEAFSINGVGQVVGQANVKNGSWSGFLWSRATGIQNLGGLPGGGGSSANGINDSGQIAGGSECGSACQHAVLWSAKGSPQDLGVLPGASFSSAYAINNHGAVVGAAGYINSEEHAFVWTSTGGMQDLNNLIPQGTGWSLQFAFAINDNGQIAGFGVLNGQERGFLLTLQ